MEHPLWLAGAIPMAAVHLVLMRHALRAGSTGWAVAIMLTPFMGGAIYYMEKYRPAARARRREEAGLPPEPQALPFR
ncbi:MAG TPA: hypothetical protein VE871_07080 [Longimicrobium sp.]|nr:hypothetical protein [Longimicrobium sp.]